MAIDPYSRQAVDGLTVLDLPNLIEVSQTVDLLRWFLDRVTDMDANVGLDCQDLPQEDDDYDCCQGVQQGYQVVIISSPDHEGDDDDDAVQQQGPPGKKRRTAAA